MLDDLGEDADGNLVWAHRADVETGGRLEPREALEGHAGLAQALDDPGRPAAAGHQAHVAGVRREDPLQRVLVGVGVRGDHHRRVPRDAGTIERGGGLFGAEREDGVLGGASKRCQRLDHRPVTHENQHGVREAGLHVDLQRAAAVARHRVLDHARRAAGTARAFADEPDQSRPAVLDGRQGFTDDDRLRARAADPAGDRAVGAHERLGPRLGGRRRLAPDHRRQRERLAAALEIRGEREQLVHSVTPFSRSTFHTFAGVIGMSM